MVLIAIRTFILYLIALFVIRVMGQGELSKMDPFQTVVLFMVSNLAAFPIESPDISMFTGLTALLTLLFIQVLFSFLSLKSRRLRKLLSGKSSLLVEKGELDTRELARLRITLDDLSSQLRLKNFPSLNDVDYAVLEPNGDLSVIPKYEKAAVTRADLGCGKKPQELPLILIADGAFCRSNLQKAGFSKESLLEQLRKQGAPELSRIFLCYRDETGTLQTYLREQFDLEEVPPCAHC
ncbi:MAG: DUF421 domain-containing protein [Clostridiales bacterium]|nr:DUF421 domain-containing protein [Clostridiales bacterium]